jgi:hypothetical protein
MRRIMLVVTVALVMAVMMVVMAGTASAQATFTPLSCLLPPTASEATGREGTGLQVPAPSHPHGGLFCTGRPFNP